MGVLSSAARLVHRLRLSDLQKAQMTVTIHAAKADEDPVHNKPPHRIPQDYLKRHADGDAYCLKVDAMGAETEKDVELVVVNNKELVWSAGGVAPRSVLELPEDADPDGVYAVLDAGMFTIFIPKKKQAGTAASAGGASAQASAKA